jgi:hypothetical protein
MNFPLQGEHSVCGLARTPDFRTRNLLQLGYLEVTVQEKLRSGWPGPFLKVEECCD